MSIFSRYGEKKSDYGLVDVSSDILREVYGEAEVGDELSLFCEVY